jgi:hypothetical protein
LFGGDVVALNPSLAYLFAPDPRMREVLARRDGITFERPLFPWVKGGMFAALADETAALILTEDNQPILLQGVLPSA